MKGQTINLSSSNKTFEGKTKHVIKSSSFLVIHRKMGAEVRRFSESLRSLVMSSVYSIILMPKILVENSNSSISTCLFIFETLLIAYYYYRTQNPSNISEWCLNKTKMRVLIV